MFLARWFGATILTLLFSTFALAQTPGGFSDGLPLCANVPNPNCPGQTLGLNQAFQLKADFPFSPSAVTGVGGVTFSGVPSAGNVPIASGPLAAVWQNFSLGLDTNFGTTRGSILERGAAGWQIVTPGTSGLPWVSNGAGADPSYQALTAAGIASSTVTGGNIASSTVANSNLANMAAGTVKCNQNTGTTPQDCSPNAADKIIYVSTGGSDSNSGTSPFFPKLTLQAAENAANPNGIVYAGAGTFTLGSALQPQPGVRLTCSPGTIITQANATNLNPMINFATNTANAASIDHCIIDGNRAGNTDAAGAGLINLINVGAVNDVLLEYDTIRNGNGAGILVTTGLRPVVRFNKFTNFFDIVVVINTGVSQTLTAAQINDNIFSPPIGFHAIYATQSDRNTVCRNYIDGGVITGAPGSLTHLTTAGTAVTFVSGQNFANVSAGQILVTNSGAEFLITVVNSATSLTLATSAGTLTNVLAAIGPGDLIDINNSAYWEVCDNTFIGGVSDAIAPNNFVTPNGETVQKINIHGNNIFNPGEYGVYVASVAGSSQVNDIKIYGNLIVDAAQDGAAFVASGVTTAIGVQGTQINNVWVDGNSIRDDQGTPTISNWMLAASSAGTIFVGAGNTSNINAGTTPSGVVAANTISGGISSVVLSAGWGTTANVTGIVSQGYGYNFVVNSSGAGQAANPTITVNRVVTEAQNPPIMICQMAAGTGTLQFIGGEQNSGTTIDTLFYNGTPTAGQNYTIYCK